MQTTQLSSDPISSLCTETYFQVLACGVRRQSLSYLYGILGRTMHMQGRTDLSRLTQVGFPNFSPK